MADFTINSADVRAHAGTLSGTVAPPYATAAANLVAEATIPAPGFGIALDFLQALYLQKIDFLAKDLNGAHDIMVDIAARLNTMADEADRAENLHIAGFGGTPQPQESLWSALGQTAAFSGESFALLSGALPLGVVYATSALMDTAAALCPPFIPAAIAGTLLIAHIPGIVDAASNLSRESGHVKTMNTNYQDISSAASSSWSGAGKDNFGILTTEIKSHLDEIADYIGKLGDALNALATVLSTTWITLGAIIVPFLAWLIMMRAAQLFPPAAAALEPIIESTGAYVAGMSTKITLGLVGVAAILSSVFSDLIKDILSVAALPDSGQAGVPDLTEIHIDTNFRVA